MLRFSDFELTILWMLVPRRLSTKLFENYYVLNSHLIYILPYIPNTSATANKVIKLLTKNNIIGRERVFVLSYPYNRGCGVCCPHSYKSGKNKTDIKGTLTVRASRLAH